MAKMKTDRPSFETDTLHRLAVEIARYWVIESYLRTGELPDKETRFAYPDGPVGFDWGNPPNPSSDKAACLKGKRVSITFDIEDM